MSLQTLSMALTFFSIVLIYQGFAAIKKTRKEVVDNRLKKYTQNLHVTPRSKKNTEIQEPLLRSIFRYISKALVPNRLLEKAELELARGDIPLRPEEYISLRIISVTVLGLVTYIFSFNLLLTFIMVVLTVIIPPLLLKRARNERMNKFNSQLGEGLIIMANSLRAGLSFMQAIDTLKKEMPPPLSIEFGRLLKEINLGVTTDEALDNLINRVASDDLDLVVTSVKIQRQVGGNLAEVLDKIGYTIQQRIKLKRELKTLTAQGRISGVVIGLLPVFIIVVVSLINPTYIMQLFDHPIGYILVFWAVCSELVGFLVIKKIVSIEL